MNAIILLYCENAWETTPSFDSWGRSWERSTVCLWKYGHQDTWGTNPSWDFCWFRSLICFTPVKGFIPTSWGFTHTHQVLGVAHMVQVLGLSLNTESPTSRLQTGTSCQICGGIRLKIKDTINEMHLNQPQTIPPSPVHGKIVFHKTGPWCQKDCGHLKANIHILNFIYFVFWLCWVFTAV